MEYVTGTVEKKLVSIEDILLGEWYGETINLRGAVHSIREMGGVAFIIVRRYDGLVQCVLREDSSLTMEDINIREGATVEITGIPSSEERAPFGFEITITAVTILSEPAQGETYPIPINKWKLNTSLETKLGLRPVALRNIRERSVFKIQEGLVRGFREFLYSQNFTEIRSPKIVAGNAEGGANIFKLEYFGKKAFLAQSPQFYKQMMVPVYDRVFEIAPVFRAEKHNTTRHLNEYTSVDFEMGYIDSFHDIMNMECKMLQYTFEFLKKNYKKELEILKVELPDISRIPSIRFDEAKDVISKKYERKMKNPYDLEPEEEVLIGKYFKEEFASDFVFVTHYPSKKRPFYAMDDSENKKFTLSFDLLYKGMEITTGGQRIHQYEAQVEKLIERGMDPGEFTDYLMLHKYGTPPHGGLGIGLERFTMKLLDESNIRETTLFPRDVTRLVP